MLTFNEWLKCFRKIELSSCSSAVKNHLHRIAEEKVNRPHRHIESAVSANHHKLRYLKKIYTCIDVYCSC